MTHPFASCPILLALALSLGTSLGCGAPEAEAGGAKTPQSGPEKRETEIKSEACDANVGEVQKVDVNGDKKDDIIHVMRGGKEACRLVDLNMDGILDLVVFYDDQGRERRREADFDRDGRVDEIAVFANGVLKLKMRETNFDNKLDTWDYYENGRLAKRERDSDGDGFVDQWWTFNNPQNPRCAIVATDRNADGKPDPDSVVDLCGESYGAPKGMPAAAPTAAPAAPAGAPSAAPTAAPAAAPPPPPSAGPVAPPPPASAAPAAPPAKQPPKPPAPTTK